ncbi:hypothetical protein FA95DRAFT_1574454 [Auriscalpium vulgare]|uniref:Uncharacterized protein n=1 Tax=Auriscalpium vulgare TaxID=40419 RepID=A0ACB8RK31_9AGAM|nr:hypothetical protein FA95DRAFT_1574454 [Auriscalpium vulgare]
MSPAPSTPQRPPRPARAPSRGPPRHANKGTKTTRAPVPPIRVHPPSLSINTDLSDSDDSDTASLVTARRWSDLVPPQTALTFVALYDPGEGLLSFSGASLLPSTPAPACPARPSSTTFPSDGQSEVLTIDRLGACTPALSTAQLTSDTGMADMQSMLDAYFRAGATNEALGARASSALEGMYAFGGASKYGSAPYLARVSRALLSEEVNGDGESLFAWSWLDRLGDQLILNPYIDTRTVPTRRGSEESDDVGSPFNDSGYAGDNDYFADKYALCCGAKDDGEASFVGPHERSAFSVTTTSTSDYIDVHVPPTPSAYATLAPDPPPSARSSIWSTLEAPDQASVNFLACSAATTRTQASSPDSPRRPRRLHKLRSYAQLPARATDVLARQSYNHDLPSPPLPSPHAQGRAAHSSAPPVMDAGRGASHGRSGSATGSLGRRGRAVWERLSRFRKDDGEPWVCVEVKHLVTQHALRERDLDLP